MGVMVLLLGWMLNGQDSKATEKLPRTVEYVIGPVKVGLSPSAAWEVTKAAGSAQYLSASLQWQLLDTWRWTKAPGLTIRVFAVQGPGLKANNVADIWFDNAKAAGVPNIIVKSDVSSRADTAIFGRDLEVDLTRFRERDLVRTYVWCRVITVSPDAAVVLYAEDSPVTATGFRFNQVHLLESHVDEVRACFDSLRSDVRRKDESWKRGPEIEMRGGYQVGVTMKGPPEWDFDRMGHGGGIVWKDPRNSARYYVVEINPSKVQGAVDAARAMVEATNGEIVADRVLDGPGHGRELVTVSLFEGARLWHRRRLWQCRDDMSAMSVHLFATVPLAVGESLPSLEVRRETDVLFNGMRMSCDAW